MVSRLENEPRKLLRPEDFAACALWKYDDEVDLYYPVLSAEQLPEAARDLMIRAEFRTPSGVLLNGYVVGIHGIFSIGLFGDDNIYYVNTNLLDLSRRQMQSLLANQPNLTGKTLEDLFPLEYVTTIREEAFSDFSGRFDLPSSRVSSPPKAG